MAPSGSPPFEVWSPTFCWSGAERESECVCVTAREQKVQMKQYEAKIRG